MPIKKRKTVKKAVSRKRGAKLASMGSTIMSMAKKIRRANPRKKWTTCVSEAGKAYKRSR